MSTDETPRLGLPDMPDTPELYPDIVADAFARLDAFTDLYLKGQFVNTPPALPADGDAYLTGGSPTGAWSGAAYKIATCRDGAWTLLAPFNGLRAYVASTGGFIVYENSVWTDWNSLVGGSEGSVASAATCDIGAAGSLLLQVTGTTTITSFGTAANKLRFLRFAGALTLTHNATSLILPGAANIATAAGDMAIFASDGSGNWRCRQYSRASGQPVATALSVASLTTSGNASIGGAMTGAAATFSGALAGQSVQATAGNVKMASGYSLEWNGGTEYINQQAGHYLDVGVNSLQIARFYGTSVVVGTTAGGGWTAAAKMEVAGANDVFSVFSTSTGVAKTALLIRADYGGSNLVSFCYSDGLSKGSVTYTGGGTGVAYNTSSDMRLKIVLEQQRDWQGAIRALWIGEFDKYADFGKAGVACRDFGVLAQQAHQVLGGLGVTVPADENQAWMASAEPFAFLSLWGVKDLYAMLDALAARVAMLEAAHAGS
jgi:hypothetical protein